MRTPTPLTWTIRKDQCHRAGAAGLNIGYPNTTKPFDDVRVRKAVNRTVWRFVSSTAAIP